MNNLSINDTIAAIATPLGAGGIGVVRLSGDKSFEIISKIFSKSLKKSILPELEPNKIYHGWIKDNEKPVDEVIVLVFKAPNSYTGEDVIEIQGHGGINIVKKILSLCLKNGARMAQKGEFTKKAFLNGKLDLSKAEAVLDLIHSKTDKFASVSANNLSGRLASYINEIRQDLIKLLASITAAIDFPEEVDEPEYSEIENTIVQIVDKINKILDTAKTSNLMRQGFKVALAGRPNVGKSSIFNTLLDMERAIVTDIAGTTRDIIQESIDLNGIPLTLIDTAGIREIKSDETADYIESIGIDITKNCIKQADLVLFVYDLNSDFTQEDKIIYEEIKDNLHIIVGSKADLSNNLAFGNTIMLSSKAQTGFENLKNEIQKLLLSQNISEETEFSTNLRQQECLNKAKESLIHALETTKIKEIQDFISIDLKSALLYLGEITGEVVTEEILDNVFENFCVGK